MTDQIFRLEIFVRSKMLGEVYAYLTSRVMEVSPPQLVNNLAGKDGSGKLREMIKKADVPFLFAAWAKEHKLSKLTASPIRDFVATFGGARSSYSYYLTTIKDAGLLKKTGEGSMTVWKVNPRKVAVWAKRGAELRQQMDQLKKETSDGA